MTGSTKIPQAITEHLKRLVFGLLLCSLFTVVYLKVDNLRAYEPGVIPLGTELLVLLFPDTEISIRLTGTLLIALGYLLFDTSSKNANSLLAFSTLTTLVLWVDYFAELPEMLLIRIIWPGYEKWGVGIYLDEIAFPLIAFLSVAYLLKRTIKPSA